MSAEFSLVELINRFRDFSSQPLNELCGIKFTRAEFELAVPLAFIHLKPLSLRVETSCPNDPLQVQFLVCIEVKLCFHQRFHQLNVPGL